MIINYTSYSVFREKDCDIHQYLVVAKVRDILSANKLESHTLIWRN